MKSHAVPLTPHRLSPAVLALGVTGASALSAVAGLALADAARAVVDIPPGVFVVDEAQVLTPAQENEVSQAIEDLRRSEGQGLYVLYVDDFGDAASSGEYIAEVAQDKGVGDQESILAIAVDSRQVGFDAHQANSIAPLQQEISAEYILPAMPAPGDDDWVTPALSAVEGITDATDGSLSGSAESGESGGGGTGGLLAGGLVAAALAGGGIALASRNRKKKSAEVQSARGAQGPKDPLDEMSVEELRTKAGSLLVAADDAIRSSEQEVGFALASYGEESVETFRKDIEVAKDHMRESFQLQNQLDDHIPDTEEQKRAWLKDIIARCEAVGASLSAHQEEFNELRHLEDSADSALADLRARAAQAADTVSGAEQQLVALHGKYADSALVEVTDNANQARERLQFVQAAVAKAEESLASSDRSTAVLAVRAGEEAVAQTVTLVEAVAKAGQHLDQSMENLRVGVSQTTQDLAQARALVDSGQHRELAGPIAGVQQTLGRVKAGVSSGRPDPVDLLKQLEKAHRQLDAPLAGIRDRQEQERRAASSLQGAIMQAQAQIDGTQDFIAARRGAVGSQARTKVAEAERTLQQAVRLSGQDPVTALNLANQASSLADRASQLAQQDLNSWGGGYAGGGSGQHGGYGHGYGRGGGAGGSFAGGLGGAILGGILMGGMFGGDHDGGGDWGGGGFGGFGGGGLGGGDFGGGGFGDASGGSF